MVVPSIIGMRGVQVVVPVLDDDGCCQRQHPEDCSTIIPVMATLFRTHVQLEHHHHQHHGGDVFAGGVLIYIQAPTTTSSSSSFSFMKDTSMMMMMNIKKMMKKKGRGILIVSFVVEFIHPSNQPTNRLIN